MRPWNKKMVQEADLSPVAENFDEAEERLSSYPLCTSIHVLQSRDNHAKQKHVRIEGRFTSMVVCKAKTPNTPSS